MDLWTIFAILLAALVVATVLGYLLRSRLRAEDLWQEHVETHAPAANSSVSHRIDPVLFPRVEQIAQQGAPVMSSTNTTPRPPREQELRRSSRVENPVTVVVLGTNRQGESFQERTSAVSFNLHGCRYSSRHDYPRESWVTLQVTGTDGAAAPPMRARVCSIQSAQSPRELCQVGVELEKPANIWGVRTVPEDWQKVLNSTASTANDSNASTPQEPKTSVPQAAAATATALDPGAPPATFLPRSGGNAERRAEVAVFPNPPASEAATSTAASADRVTFTSEQLLQALQGKLQLAAEHAVETAFTGRVDAAVKQALAKLEDAWKANLRQTEEFSAVRLAEVQNRWERELVVYRGRAEEVSRRVEALASSSRQSLGELQAFAERIKTEIEPQFQRRVDESLARAASELQTKAGELSEQQKASITEAAEAASEHSRAQLEETVDEVRRLVSAARTPAAAEVPPERLEAVVNAARESALQQTEERLSSLWKQFEQQQDVARRRADEFAQHLEMLSTQLNEANAKHQQSVEELRGTLANVGGTSSEGLEPTLKAAREQIFNHLEWRLGEVAGRADQQHQTLEQRADELLRRLNGLAGETANMRSQAEQNAAELRSSLDANRGLPQEHLDATLNAAREQLVNHFEWRLGEVFGQFERQHEAARVRSEELSQRVENLWGELGRQAEQNRARTESIVHELQPNRQSAEEIIERAAKDFETAAARISDRQLVRLMQQKQSLSAEAALELEAQASETRSQLQKAANSTLEEFRTRFESQIDQAMAEATDRVASSLASLDAESRSAVDARRREMERHMNRAAEQSTAEFRSGIKAFLYSSLVAALSAVDEHAQSTLASLGKDAKGEPLPLEDTRDSGKESSTNGPSSNGSGL
jgi:hypothetical protein